MCKVRELSRRSVFVLPQAVDVQAVTDVPAAVSATVEPANMDDWEVVEANAEYLTDQMLNQASCSLHSKLHLVAVFVSQFIAN